MEALCAYIFDKNTSDLLGSVSKCTVHGNSLIISLAGDVKIRPGQHRLSLSPSNRLLAAVLGAGRDPAVGAAVFSGSLATVGSCRDCSRTAVPVSLTVSGLRNETACMLSCCCSSTVISLTRLDLYFCPSVCLHGEGDNASAVCRFVWAHALTVSCAVADSGGSKSAAITGPTVPAAAV